MNVNLRQFKMFTPPKILTVSPKLAISVAIELADVIREEVVAECTGTKVFEAAWQKMVSIELHI